MEEILQFILASPALRTFVEGLAIKLVAEILHRRATEPDYLAKSDTVFAEYAQAKTPEEVAHAQIALQSLLASESS